jgi:hypothetical protein
MTGKLHSPNRGIVYLVVSLTSAILFVIVCAHKPMSIFADAIGDDGLFISLGRHIAQGDWLGSFDVRTLAKGPGYPVFLATNYYLGLPVSIAQAIFFCICLGFFSCTVSKIFRSAGLGMLLFMLTLWYPVFVGERVLRESVYCGQVFLVLACLLTALFVASNPLSRLRWGCLTGLTLGWFWLTREEGIWLVPGIAVVLFQGIHNSWAKYRSLWPLVVPVLSAGFIFLCTQFAFAAANLLIYGSFIGVDMKASFQKANSALQSVEDGDHIPHVAVSRSTRDRIYSVSPTFSTLKAYLDQPSGPLHMFFDASCKTYSWTCGDLITDQFVWALRDAAALQGHFQSPAAEEVFFTKIYNEVQAACHSGQLHCGWNFIPFMPRLSKTELKELPVAIEKGISWLALRFPLEYSWPSTGTPEELVSALTFLNNPTYTPLQSHAHYVLLQGWYYLREQEWPRISLATAGGDLATLRVTRVASPDLVKHFNDKFATHQRFKIRSVCELDCDFVLEQGSNQLRVKLTEIFQGQRFFDGNFGQLFFETVAMSNLIEPGFPARISSVIRGALFRGYQIAMPIILTIGIASFFVAVVLAWRARCCFMILSISAAVWILVGSRLGLLVLLDVSSIPAFHPYYLSPGLYLSIVAPILSVGCLIKIKLEGGVHLRDRIASRLRYIGSIDPSVTALIEALVGAARKLRRR